METLEDYYLDSLSELKIDGQMYRTKGSDQLQVWYDETPQTFSNSKFISDRKYFKGMYKNKRFFGKQFVKPNLSYWSIRRSVEYQLESLLLLRDIEQVPAPLFFTNNMVGMEYIEGKTIKELALEDELSAILVRHIIKQLMNAGLEIVSRLETIGRRYDCGYNNILVKKNGRIMFVDFDHVNIIRSIDTTVQVLKDLVTGVASFTKGGQLQQGTR